MRRSMLAALAFTFVLAVPFVAGASPNPPAPAHAPPAAPHVVRPADGPGSNMVARAHHRPTRAMDLMGWIDVRGERNERRHAIDELKRKAIAMGADGIANVEFHPGQGGGPGHYTASAVRFRKVHHRGEQAHAAPAAQQAAQARTPAPAAPKH